MAPTRIRQLRRALGDTQEQFAKRLGVSVRSVAGWEAGSHRPLPMALKAIEALKPKPKRRRRKP